jgi:metal-responsive CopG/Arc/MetJ family transcriptional regulator
MPERGPPDGWISGRYSSSTVRKILVSLPEVDLRRIDEAARHTGESRSAFLRSAAIAELERRSRRAIDNPKVRHAFEQLMRLQAGDTVA